MIVFYNNSFIRNLNINLCYIKILKRVKFKKNYINIYYLYSIRI